MKATNRRKVLAILAGGLVLGVGAAVTLAAWNDSEFATGTFTAGSFNLEGATDGSTFTDHPTAPGAALDFTLAADNIAPEDVLYASFAVRLDADTTHDATVAVTSAGTSGSVAGLTYGLVTTATATCDATAFAAPVSTLVATGTALDTAAGSFSLSAGAGTDPGDPVYLCYQVSADTNLVQEQTGAATWQFEATSD